MNNQVFYKLWPVLYCSSFAFFHSISHISFTQTNVISSIYSLHHIKFDFSRPLCLSFAETNVFKFVDNSTLNQPIYSPVVWGGSMSPRYLLKSYIEAPPPLFFFRDVSKSMDTSRAFSASFSVAFKSPQYCSKSRLASFCIITSVDAEINFSFACFQREVSTLRGQHPVFPVFALP